MTLFSVQLELGPETRAMIERVAAKAVMHLELGPITQLGLLDPFHVVFPEATDQLDRGEHCAISAAAARGDTAQLVSLLNQEARFGPEGTGPHSCSNTQLSECTTAMIACNNACSFGSTPTLCNGCFAELGATQCIP